ncbi:MAG: type II secretion system F family protein [Candidatus Micrarchaeota archaeon]
MLAFLKSKSHIRILEAEMPLVLRTFGMLLDINVPFVRALEIVAKEGEIGKELSKVVDEIENGASVPKALAKFAEKTESGIIKKSIAQLISAYEHGARGTEIIQIADDLISFQQYGMRNFVSKSSLFGLLFVIFSAVAPTFFLVFATAGKFALEIEIGKETFLLIFLILFPLINALLLATSDAQMPPNIFRISGRSERKNIYIFFAIVITLALVMLIDLDLVIRIVLVFAVVFLSYILFKNDFIEERKTEKIEAALPNALLSVSGLPKNYGIEKIFEKIASEKNELGFEIKKMLMQLRANVSMENALMDLWKRNNSFMLRRMSELVLNSHIAGANISEKMHEMAEDLLKFGELQRERENALSMQKYTLIMGAFIVPLILTSSLSLVAQISSFMDIGSNNEVLKIAPNAISAYIIIYSALAAFYISKTSQRSSHIVSYFAIMSIAGLAGFYLLFH